MVGVRVRDVASPQYCEMEGRRCHECSERIWSHPESDPQLARAMARAAGWLFREWCLQCASLAQRRGTVGQIFLVDAPSRTSVGSQDYVGTSISTISKYRIDDFASPYVEAMPNQLEFKGSI